MLAIIIRGSEAALTVKYLGKIGGSWAFTAKELRTRRLRKITIKKPLIFSIPLSSN